VRHPPAAIHAGFITLKRNGTSCKESIWPMLEIAHITINYKDYYLIKCCCCTNHGSCPPACSGSELSSETMNPFRRFCMTTAGPLPTQESTTNKIAGLHTFIERDSNTRFQCSSGPRRKRPRPCEKWDRHQILFIN
jgi:hypothetical protein